MYPGMYPDKIGRAITLARAGITGNIPHELIREDLVNGFQIPSDYATAIIDIALTSHLAKKFYE